MNIKYFVIISAILVVAGKVNAQINFDTSNIANGEYAYKFIDDLYSKNEVGKLDGEGNPIVTGDYRYVVGDKEYIVSYTADKDGYHPKLSILEYQRPPFPPAFAAPPSVVATLLGK